MRHDAVAARLLLTVHDELVLEVPEEEIGTVSEIVRQEMEGVATLAVPLVVDLDVGDSWYHAKS
jgi:DNA polymerase-1